MPNARAREAEPPSGYFSSLNRLPQGQVLWEAFYGLAASEQSIVRGHLSLKRHEDGRGIDANIALAPLRPDLGVEGWSAFLAYTFAPPFINSPYDPVRERAYVGLLNLHPTGLSEIEAFLNHGARFYQEAYTPHVNFDSEGSPIGLREDTFVYGLVTPLYDLMFSKEGEEDPRHMPVFAVLRNHRLRIGGSPYFLETNEMKAVREGLKRDLSNSRNLVE